MSTSRRAALVVTLLLCGAGCANAEPPSAATGADARPDASSASTVPDVPPEAPAADAPCGVADSACTSGNPCKTAALSCGSGAPVCTTTGNSADGTLCGTRAVCDHGICVDCTDGIACTPKPCRVGAIACGSGLPVCNDGGQASDGSACGASMVCKAGACVGCELGKPCAPTDPCHAGATDCSTGSPVCKDSGPRPDGTACGASATCVSGVCACAGGKTRCAGACVDLGADPANCGACGDACESGTCVRGACPTFFGAWEEGCTAIAGSGCSAGTSCMSPDAASGGCSCPAGSTAHDVSGWLHTETPWAHVEVCTPGATSKPSDFGGAFGRKDPVGGGCTRDDGAPIPADGCNAPNPYTGACSCPAGSTAISMRTIVYCTATSGTIGGSLTFCWNGSVPNAGFGGAYEQDDAVAGGVGCRVGNPATGGCSCPAGTTPHDLRVWVDISGGIIGARVTTCSNP